jgi:hypothetical protein
MALKNVRASKYSRYISNKGQILTYIVLALSVIFSWGMVIVQTKWFHMQLIELFFKDPTAAIMLRESLDNIIKTSTIVIMILAAMVSLIFMCISRNENTAPHIAFIIYAIIAALFAPALFGWLMPVTTSVIFVRDVKLKVDEGEAQKRDWAALFVAIVAVVSNIVALLTPILFKGMF